MAESSMFFDSTVDDRRRYSSAAFAKFMRLFYSDGVVMNGDSSLMVRKSKENLLVTVDTGSAVIRGYTYFNEDEPLTLAIPPAHASLARIDRVVLRLDLTLGGRSITASVLQGTPSSSPVPPELTRTENVWELSLAQLRIPASAVAVQTVTDERYQEGVCGIAEGLYTLDATEFQQQAEDILENLAVNSVYANPNLLLDSNFRLWDEGESISVSPNGERYTATLWWVANKSSRLITVSKHSGGGMLIQFSGGASQTVQIAQPIEDAELLNGKTVTLSWSEDGEIYVKSYVFRASESNSAVIEITRSSGSVVIDWMKLELGSVATQFVPRSIAEEKCASLRYYQLLNSIISAHACDPSGDSFYSYMLTEMQRTPDVSGSFRIYNPNGNTEIVHEIGVVLSSHTPTNVTFTYRVPYESYLSPLAPIKLDARMTPVI